MTKIRYQPCTRYSSDKDLNKLAKACKRAGWTVEFCGSGHLRWQSPDGGKMFFSPSTPNRNGRAFKAVICKIRRAVGMEVARALISGMLAFMALPALAADLTGVPTVVDGDTLRLDGATVRLWGVDAPEGKQHCSRPRQDEYDCGRVAAGVLQGLIGGRAIVCRQRDTDQYRRVVASCTVEGVDLGSMMVNLGWAVDYTEISHGAYQLEEGAARKAKRGMWAGEFDRPAEWRRRNR